MKLRTRLVVVMAAALGTVSLVGILPATAGAHSRTPSQPVFSGSTVLKAKTLKSFTFKVKAKGNPTPTISAVSGIPAGVTFTAGAAGTATLQRFAARWPLSAHRRPGQQRRGGAVTKRTSPSPSRDCPGVRHVFVIMLENEGYSATFGNPSERSLPGHHPARSQGALLENYYGVGHFSNDNYVGFVSGQPPNRTTRPTASADSSTSRPATAQDANGIQQGAGCVYPARVQTVADQLTARGDTWKAYEEDMGNDPTRESATCGHPTVGSPGRHRVPAEAGDGYATRHDPFVYFHSIIDNTGGCNAGCRAARLHLRGPARRHPGRGHRAGHRPPVRGHHAELQLHHSEPL